VVLAMYTEIVLVDCGPRRDIEVSEAISNKLFFALYSKICNLQLQAFSSKLLRLLNINIINLNNFFTFIS
jgi:hypothetical protein